MNTEQHSGQQGLTMEVELRSANHAIRFSIDPESMQIVFPADQFAQLYGFPGMQEMLLDNRWMDALIEIQKATGKFPVSPPPPKDNQPEN